ncbi:hypothetical protein Cgig2_017286 [Carnegiea gigantea]|uniref:Uncharacterized protein n=1 Tax=Carnegiea gigantea TaxID=171969 RepID=A0A9Q1QKW6_9CARY|nr:hypothetical protein Cgig2_017286 [Carnegiea gigantea]
MPRLSHVTCLCSLFFSFLSLLLLRPPETREPAASPLHAAAVSPTPPYCGGLQSLIGNQATQCNNGDASTKLWRPPQYGGVGETPVAWGGWAAGSRVSGGWRRRRERKEKKWEQGQVPALGGAMCACTWHFFYNAESLEVLVALQAALTVFGNATMCIAAFRIYKSQSRSENL